MKIDYEAAEHRLTRILIKIIRYLLTLPKTKYSQTCI